MTRFLSLILIAAILACPFACGWGIVPCCGWEKSASVRCPVHGGKCHCDLDEVANNDECEGEKNCPHQDFPEDAPCDHDHPCQGVCGGAVFEKPFDPQFDGGVALILLVVLDWSDQHRPIESNRLFNQSDPVSGRTLRTLHMSYLC